MASASLIFQLVKNHHSKRHEARRGVQFSSEDGNILNINSAHHSGYTPGAIDIRAKGARFVFMFVSCALVVNERTRAHTRRRAGKGIKIGAKSKAASQKPRVSFKYKTHKGFGRSTNAKVRNTVQNSSRGGLTRAALARVSRLEEVVLKAKTKAASKAAVKAGKPALVRAKHAHVRQPVRSNCLLHLLPACVHRRALTHTSSNARAVCSAFGNEEGREERSSQEGLC